jgi:hypothetical protein
MMLGLPGGCAPVGASTNGPAPAPSTSGNPGPKPTSWPPAVVSGSISLGQANADFTTMSADLAAAVDSGDPARMLVTIDDALTFLTENQKNIPRLQAYDGTRTVGDGLAAAYSKMIDGATRIRDGLRSGDGSAVSTGFQTFADGSRDYAAVAPDLADLAERAVLMQRGLLK